MSDKKLRRSPRKTISKSLAELHKEKTVEAGEKLFQDIFDSSQETEPEDEMPEAVLQHNIGENQNEEQQANERANQNNLNPNNNEENLGQNNAEAQEIARLKEQTLLEKAQTANSRQKEKENNSEKELVLAKNEQMLLVQMPKMQRPNWIWNWIVDIDL